MTIFDIWGECTYGAAGSKRAKSHSKKIKRQYIFKSEKKSRNDSIGISFRDVEVNIRRNS